MKTSSNSLLRAALITLNLAFLGAGCSAQTAPPALAEDLARVPLTFSGGHETLEADHGRPVVLIAAALGVTPEVFREAFNRVHPVGAGKVPTGDEARQNKAVLLGALKKYGITNERLDEVSDFYRYPPERGGVWKNTPTKADALVKNGAIVGYEITDGGAGYSSVPAVSIPGFKDAHPQLKLVYGKELKTNGAIAAIGDAMPPAVGEKAADFSLTALGGEKVSLSKTLQKGPVVLVMLRGYPGYQCPICTAQVGQMLNKNAQLQAAGATVLLVYPGPGDGLKAHAAEFVRGKDIPANFNLLLDPDYSFTKLYGLRWEAKGETAYPATFVLNQDGTVRFSKVSHEHGDRAKIEDVLAALGK